MSREKKIQFNVNEKEYERLKSHAESEGLSMAEVLRDYIKTLTPPKGGRTHAVHPWECQGRKIRATSLAK
ncbi:ribbon-helix-helix protein, CopG family [Planktothrix prolifica]|uniref:ribbon-helix-helix protein, CopG family n=1 Tax=Planktothrix prolifica TaxID=54307 RepID=UPI00047DED93|nr:ribbon-helix-helix protein, CopG family [Planktothrix prolifica]